MVTPGTLPHFLTRAGLSIKGRLEEKFQDFSPGLTLPQYALLRVLERRDGIAQNEIARRAFKDKTNVARIIASLEEDNLITRRRDPEDQRSYRVYLTDQGKKLLQQLFPVIEEVVQEATSGVSATDLDATLLTLQRIYLNLQKE